MRLCIEEENSHPIYEYAFFLSEHFTLLLTNMAMPW